MKNQAIKIIKHASLLGILALIGCTEHTNESDVQTINITANTIWKDKGNSVDYRYNKTIFITNGATLTVEPGVTIEFTDSNSGIWLDKGVLKMEGTENKPIVLQGNSNEPGSWTGIRFESETYWQDNKRMFLDHVQILNAGIPGNSNGSYHEAAITIFQDGFCSIKNSTISGSLCNGIYLHNDSIELYNNKIINNAWAPIKCFIRYINNFDTLSDYKENNGKQYIDVVEGSINFPDTTIIINPLNVPYRLTGTFQVNDSIVVTPGCVFEMGENSIIENGYSGCFNAVGTPEKGITFKGVTAGNGTWLGIIFLSNSEGNQLEWCSIKDAGSTYIDGNCNNNPSSIQVGDGKPARLNMNYCTLSGSMGWMVWVSSGANFYNSNNKYSNYISGEIYNE